MTLQQIYTAISRHLLEQNERSEDEEGNCLYRGPRGLKCPVGALIKDEAYSPEIEGAVVGAFAVDDALAKSGVPVRSDTAGLMFELQWVHDKEPPERWQLELKRIAAQHNLEPIIA